MDFDVHDCVADRFAPQYDLTRLLTNVEPGCTEELLDAHALRDLWRRHAQMDRQGSCRCELSCYLHIPFCKQKCSYCCYYSVPLERTVGLNRYLDSLRAQLAFFSPAFSGRRFETLYIGGGTPSLMEPCQLEGLLKPLFSQYAFCDTGERAFECNPFSVNAEKLAVLERFGFNRISMGVQSFRPGVLRRENRGYQTCEIVAKAIDLIQSRGRFILNLDLLVGLRGDDHKSFLETLGAILALKPNTITIYPVKPTVPYLVQYYKGEARRFDSDLARRYDIIGQDVASLARKRGYRWRPEVLRLNGNNWFLARQPAWTFEYEYSDITPGPASLFALGPTTRSRIAGELVYSQKGAHDTAFHPKAPLWQGRRIDQRGEMRKFVFLELMDRSAISRKKFRTLFGKDMGTVFPQAVKALRVAGDELVLPRSTAREVFLAALPFLDQTELEGLSEVRFSLSSHHGKWFMSLRQIATAERCLVRQGALALILQEVHGPLIAARIDERLLKLVAAAFAQAAGCESNPSAARLAPHFLGKLKNLLAQLERTNLLKKGSLQLALERGVCP